MFFAHLLISYFCSVLIDAIKQPNGFPMLFQNRRNPGALLYASDIAQGAALSRPSLPVGLGSANRERAYIARADDDPK